MLFSNGCPFCKGSEAKKTPAELCRVWPSGELEEREGLPEESQCSNWLVRAVRNLFPYMATPPDLYCTPCPGYMPNADYYKNMKIKVGRIFIAHGFSDQAISFDDYKKTLQFISKKTDNITSYTDDFGHTITKEVNNRLIDWLGD